MFTLLLAFKKQIEEFYIKKKKKGSSL
jgi:hypothetical protein